MINTVHKRDTFVSWEHKEGRIEYPDDVVKFQDTEIVTIDSKKYLVANYSGDEVLTTELNYDEYFEHFHRGRLVEENKEAIKLEQGRLLDALEGTPERPGLWQRKFIEEITIKDSFDRYDELMRRKAHVINKGNAEEEELQDMAPDELLEYSFSVNLDEAPPIKIRRLTVGAFMLRFTAFENSRFEVAMESNSEMKTMFDSMTNRSHIHLDNEVIRASLSVVDRAGLLESEPMDSTYESRFDEILRDGNEDEQYRVFSYI